MAALSLRSNNKSGISLRVLPNNQIFTRTEQ
jgi:hypothetical protein